MHRRRNQQQNRVEDLQLSLEETAGWGRRQCASDPWMQLEKFSTQ